MTHDPNPQIPDPNGPPKTSPLIQSLAKHSLSLGTRLFLGTTAVLLIIACVPTRTMGALRSSRLKWQERQKEIAAAQSQSPESAQPNAAPTPTPEPEPHHD